MSEGSSSGTLARAALITPTERSSGRTSLSEPLKARPIGVRAVETITASVTGCSSSSRAGAISGRLVTDDRMRFSAGFRCGLGLAVQGLVVQPASVRAASPEDLRALKLRSRLLDRAGSRLPACLSGPPHG